jgi:flagellin-specific chaperone FliS
MSNVKEYIELIKVTGFWDDIFTDDDWVHITRVAQNNQFDVFLKHTNLTVVLNNVKLIQQLSCYFQEDANNKYFKGISDNFKYFSSTPEDLHFPLTAQISTYHRNLKYWAGAWEDMKEACHKQIQIAPEVVKYLNGSHTGFKRLAISLEKEGRYCEVVSLSKKALKQGWVGDWQNRINRNFERTNKIKILKFDLIKRKTKITTSNDIALLSKTPEFEACAPKKEMLSKPQNKFFNKLTNELNHNRYLDVEGNLSYLYLYIFELIYEANNRGYEWLSERLQYLSKLYVHEEEIQKYCHYQYLECLLGLKKYTKYLEETEPNDCTKQNMVLANLRLNVQFHIEEDANPIDLIMMFPPRVSDVIKENKSGYRKAINTSFYEYARKNGPIFTSIINELKSTNKWDINIISIPYQSIRHKLEFQQYSFVNLTAKGKKLIKELSLKSENILRKSLELPDVGAGWISETKLFNSLKSDFEFTKVIQHASPSWLGRQHFDVYFPEYKVAVEYHGQQHFEPVEFFGGEAAFKENVKRDARKIKLAKTNSVKLFVIKEGYNYDELKSTINAIINSRQMNYMDIENSNYIKKDVL